MSKSYKLRSARYFLDQMKAAQDADGGTGAASTFSMVTSQVLMAG